MNDKQGRVLLVDDDLGVLKLLMKTLGDRYEVLVAPAGYELEILVNHFTPDLMIIDLCFPDENGQQICKTMRRYREWDSMAILILSGLDEPTVAAAAIQAGADGYLTKPFDISVLRNTTAHIIESKKTSLACAGPSC